MWMHLKIVTVEVVLSTQVFMKTVLAIEFKGRIELMGSFYIEMACDRCSNFKLLLLLVTSKMFNWLKIETLTSHVTFLGNIQTVQLTKSWNLK